MSRIFDSTLIEAHTCNHEDAIVKITEQPRHFPDVLLLASESRSRIRHRNAFCLSCIHRTTLNVD